jgi:hypothetical protein
MTHAIDAVASVILCFILGLTLNNVCTKMASFTLLTQYRGAGKSLARPTSWCILFDGENISFDASLVIYI